MSEIKRTNRDNCKYYDNNSGCEFNNKTGWCMPWWQCVYFEDKNAAQNIMESTAHLTTAQVSPLSNDTPRFMDLNNPNVFPHRNGIE